METILVVDDIPENIAVLAGVLRGLYKVVVATNGADAIALVSQIPVNLILLDVMMPGMSGYEVCQRLKANAATCHIPVIFVTSLGERSEEERGLELGAADYLQKPCHASIVKLRVKLHLEQQNQNLKLERRVKERTIELEDSRREIVRRLGRAAEYRDNETGKHVIRMSKVSHLIAVASGMDSARADLLLNAAPMHDVGKIGIPDGVLLKPGKLDAAEWEVMKTHTLIGAEIIGDHDSDLLRLARIVALTHHEKWDGSGYPNGIAGDAIPLEGRIVAIADVFDALTSERPYKRAWSAGEALEYMQQQSGISFDPKLLEVFVSKMPDVLHICKKHADPEGSMFGPLC
ncbi:MAG: two-component system response regulator [Burkholderiales bacterium]